MALMNWNPEREAVQMYEKMNRLMEETRNMLDYAGGSRMARLPIDAYSTENEIVVTAALPGVNPDEVEITVEGDTLTLRGEVPARLDNVRYLFTERFHGPFIRTLQLNVPVDVDKIEATFDRGVLTLTLPKAEEIRPKVIKVKTE